jgi:hypothetical protein
MDLSPGTEIFPLIAADPLISIVLDIVTSAMLHNVAPCDYLNVRLRANFKGKLGKEGILRADY